MNKTQFIEALSAHFEGNKKAAGEALDAVIDTIQREVTRGEKVALTGFASFEKIVRDARSGRNPATGERIRIKKKSVPKVTVGADFKNIVSGAKKLPRKTAAAAGAAAKKAAPARKTAATTTTAAKKTAAKKTAAKKTAAKKTAAKKTAAKKTTAKTAAKKTAAKKTAVKKTAAKKTAAKKTAAKKTTAKKAASRS